MITRTCSPAKRPIGASCLTLEIAAVRVESVQEITEADAVSCGFRSVVGFGISTWYNPL